MKVLFILLLPFSMALSCGNSKEAIVNNEGAHSSEEFTIILQEAYGGLEKNEELVITNKKGLIDIYGIINQFRKPGLPVPEVDFNESIVVALFMGEKTTGGFSTEVKSVAIVGDEMIVSVRENGPKPTDNVTMAICQPFCFVKIPKPKKDTLVVFDKD